MVVKVAPAGDEATTNNLNTENGAIVQQPGIEPGTNIPNPGNVGSAYGQRDFGPSEQVIDRDPEENVKIKKRRTGKKWVALRIGMKVGKTSLKVVDHVADSGVVEQLSCLDSCIAAIPCGMLFCCLCKFGCAFWKARDAFKEHYGQLPCYGKGPCKKGGLFEKCPCAGEVLEEVIDAAAGGDGGDTDLATDVVMGVSEEAADAADKTSVTSSISTFSMPEWCNNAYQGCRGCLGKMKAGMSQE